MSKTSILNTQSHARVCNENEENKENDCPLIFVNQKDWIWIVMLGVDLGKVYSIDPSYSNSNLVGYDIIKYWPQSLNGAL